MYNGMFSTTKKGIHETVWPFSLEFREFIYVEIINI